MYEVHATLWGVRRGR